MWLKLILCKIVTSSFNQGYYKMLMDTLQGEQRNEAPIKSNRVLFTSFRFCTKCMCNCIEHVHYRQMASRTLWERNSLEAPQHIACACKYHAAPEQDIYYTKSDILYVYILRGLTTYCSYLQILHNFEQPWIISNSGTMDHHFRSRCPELPRGNKTPKVRTSTRIVRSGPR